ncbi:hypothetical protein R1flu_017581 [Riccia fluitans]|uniref:SCP2 domain-containing protein n=1 Tax=Riccia fluitans TaxID=41844 RepID=A0ABD1ZDF8_9MARC
MLNVFSGCLFPTPVPPIEEFDRYRERKGPADRHFFQAFYWPRRDLERCSAIISFMSYPLGSKLQSAALLDMMRGHLTTEEGKKLKQKNGLVYQINVAPKKIGFEEESFVVDLKNLKVYKGPAEGKPDATFSFVDGDFVSVAGGKLNPQFAFMRGKMKIKGSMSAAQKFTPEIFPKPSKL